MITLPQTNITSYNLFTCHTVEMFDAIHQKFFANFHCNAYGFTSTCMPTDASKLYNKKASIAVSPSSSSLSFITAYLNNNLCTKMAIACKLHNLDHMMKVFFNNLSPSTEEETAN